MLLIKNGRVVDPVTGIDQMLDLVIEDQKIVKLLKPDETVLYEKEKKPQVEDATGCVIAPGLTDVHVHFLPLSLGSYLRQKNQDMEVRQLCL